MLVIFESRQMRSDDRKGKVAVVVGTVTDDIRLFKLQKLTVSVGIVAYPL